MRTSPLRAFAKQDKKIDPDAPGTPGKPGYEPPVKRSDLDDKGKERWDELSSKKDKRVSMQDPDSGGFMRPPYKVQKDLAGNVKFYHGFKKKK